MPSPLAVRKRIAGPMAKEPEPVSGKSDSGRARVIREAIAHGFGHFEDAVYVGLGLLLVSPPPPC